MPAASALPSASTDFRGSFDLPSAGPLPRSAGSDLALISAPRWIKSWMAAAWPSSAAHINAVVPRKVSFAFTFAPLSSSTLIASTLPVRAATMRGVLPRGSCSLASAPAFSSAAMIGASPLMLASHNGVEPSRFAALGFAPARSRRSTMVLSDRKTAQCSAVAPSACGAFTSAFCRNSFSTAAWSPRMTASATSELPAAH